MIQKEIEIALIDRVRYNGCNGRNSDVSIKVGERMGRYYGHDEQTISGDHQIDFELSE